jgi:GT2 family glycosyltransferase
MNNGTTQLPIGGSTPDEPRSDRTSISVLICTLNRHELLSKALESLLKSEPEKPDQIVVVNGGSDEADAVVGKASTSTAIPILLVKTVNRNLATSRNLGLKHCTGDIVAMTDDDAVVFPDWICKLKQLHCNHPEAGAIGGLVIGMEDDKLLTRVADSTTFPRWHDECYVRTLPGVNISYKREVIARIGEQDVTLFRGEDVDFNWRLQVLGYKILFSPIVKVYHFHRPTLRGLANQQYMYGRAYVLVRRKHPDMYSIYPPAALSLRSAVKCVRFVGSAVSDAIFACCKLKGFDVIVAFPLILLLEVSWRWGMLRESFRTRRLVV